MHPLNPVLVSTVLKDISTDAQRHAVAARAARASRSSNRRARLAARRGGSPGPRLVARVSARAGRA
jgi:hypothetical protein